MFVAEPPERKRAHAARSVTVEQSRIRDTSGLALADRDHGDGTVLVVAAQLSDSLRAAPCQAI